MDGASHNEKKAIEIKGVKAVWAWHERKALATQLQLTRAAKMYQHAEADLVVDDDGDEEEKVEKVGKEGDKKKELQDRRKQQSALLKHY
jgi:hypothetical protein